MVYKLVRTDSAEACKIQLPYGVHLLGRGKFLDCDDKRVSRNHGSIEVSDSTIIIKSLHQNPCFIIKKGTDETEIIRQDQSAELSHGDRFGLLPDCYWFELLNCSIGDVDVNSQQVSQDVEEPEIEQMSETKQLSETERLPEIDQLPETERLPSTEAFPENEALNRSDDNQCAGNDNSPISNPIPESNCGDEPGSPSLIPPYGLVPDNAPIKTEPKSPEAPQSKDGESCKQTPTKRSHAEDVQCKEDEVKKIKTEPVVKQEPDDKAGPSKDQGGSSKDNASNNQPADLAGNDPNQLRERCMYGASCYRRNPQHKAQFSHPTDSDWGSGPRGQCPFGSKCVRRDPRHWRDHEHPPGVQPPGNGPGKRKRQRKESSSSEEQTPSLIVEGKRKRKPVKRPSYSDSDISEKDPFGSDESDEWVPSKDKSQDESQDFTQDW